MQPIQAKITTSAKVISFSDARNFSPVQNGTSRLSQQLQALTFANMKDTLPAPPGRWSRSTVALVAVIIAHLCSIYFLLTHSNITPPKVQPSPPMMVSLIAPPTPEPEIVPIVEPPKPVIKPKPKLKKVVKEIRPIEQPTERLIEATTEEPPIDTPAAEVTPTPEVVEAKAPPAPAPVVEEKIEPPKFGVSYLNNPEPGYPKMSRRLGEEGRVLLRVLVSEKGDAQEVSLDKTSGYERLDQAAIEAVKQWRFIPARKNNQNLSAIVIVPIKFSLGK